ncbi:hypothetical protein HMPREF1343_02461, partial [Enterococcus faecalis ERV93]
SVTITLFSSGLGAALTDVVCVTTKKQPTRNSKAVLINNFLFKVSPLIFL